MNYFCDCSGLENWFTCLQLGQHVPAVQGSGAISLRHVGSELLKSRGFTDAQTRDDMLGGAAPVAREDGPDRSKADFTWCMFAAQRGHSVKNIAARLLEVSAEAQENARWHEEGYALVTAENAAAAAERGHKQGRG